MEHKTNTAVDFCASVISDIGVDPSPAQIRFAIKERIDRLSDSELLEATAPYDCYEEETDAPNTPSEESAAVTESTETLPVVITLPKAFEITIDLARENIVDHREHPQDSANQLAAVHTVESYANDRIY
jgi:hypothetical protein